MRAIRNPLERVRDIFKQCREYVSETSEKGPDFVAPVDEPAEEPVQDGFPEGNQDMHDDTEPKNIEEKEIAALVKKLHTNLGHPHTAAFLRLLRDAGAREDVLEAAKQFQCDICAQRGRPSPTRPVTLSHVTEKWHTISLDTFWYNSHVKVDAEGNSQQFVGISLFDEATDYHQASIVRQSLEHLLFCDMMLRVASFRKSS